MTVHDISTTGLYVLTKERWPLGELIPLRVEVDGSPEDGSEPHITVQARVMRHGEDGIGLSFVLPEGMDLKLWEVLITNAVLLTDSKDVAHTLRMLRTILSLYRLCLAEAEEAILLLGGEMDPARTENALDITHKAEKLLASEPDADKMRAHPKLVASLLKYGSWAHDDLTKQLWAGLLATSCAVEERDETNQALVDILVNLTPHQCLIFVSACNWALESMSESEDHPSTRIILGQKEMIQLTGMYDISRIATDMANLYMSGIIEKKFDFTSYLPMDTFDITPTRLGLELYKNCKGHLVKVDAPPGEPQKT